MNYYLGIIALPLILCCVVVRGAAPPYGQLSVSGTKLKGAGGQDVTLHGMSLMSSSFPEGRPFYNAETVRALKCQWNSNVVRAAMAVQEQWDGGYVTEPARELARIEAVIQAAIDLGIYVIVDFHTHNADQFLDKALEFFKLIANKYGKQNPHIIYELFNEPLQVSWDSVKAYHRTVVQAIRAIDANNVIILGTTTWAQDVDLAANSPLTGFKNIMYTLHYYAATHKQELRNKVTNAINKGIAIFVTEYGTTTADGNGFVDAGESKVWWDFLDGLKISYVNWAIDNKAEKSAALIPETGSAQVGDPARWTESGKLVNAKLKSQNNGVSCSGGSSGSGGGSGGGGSGGGGSGGGTVTTTTTTTPKPKPSSGGGGGGSGGGSNPGSGSVSVSVQVQNQWEGGRVYSLVFKNNSPNPICSVRFKIQINGGRMDSKWNFDGPNGGSDAYTLPGWVRIAPGAEFRDAGLVFSGNGGSATASVIEAKNC